MFQDKILVCRECGGKFVFSGEEQELFASRGIKSEPVTCVACRKEKRAASRSEAMMAILQNPELFEVRCRVCGKVFVTMYNKVLPDVAKVCQVCAPEEFGMTHPKEDLVLNQSLGYPKYKE